MFKLFKKNKKAEESYNVIFCETNNADTIFGTYGTYNTYETADHAIRMAWHKTKEQRVNNGYKVGDAWALIKKN